MGLLGLPNWTTWPFGQSGGSSSPSYTPGVTFAPGANQSQGGAASRYANLASVIGSDLPYLTNAANQTATSSAQNQQNIAATITPQQLQLLTQMYQQYMPGLTSAASAIQQQQQQQTAGGNAAVAAGPQGQAALQAALANFYQANPNFQTLSSTGTGALGNLISSIDLSGALSPSMQRAIGQSLAQQNTMTGNYNTPSQSQTVGNAMNYGNAVYQRQEQAKSDLSNAISQATAFLPTTRTGIDSWGISTGTNPSTTATNNPTNLFGQATGTGTGFATGSTSNQNNLLGGSIGTGGSMQNALTASDASRYASRNQLTGNLIGSVLGLI